MIWGLQCFKMYDARCWKILEMLQEESKFTGMKQTLFLFMVIPHLYEFDEIYANSSHGNQEIWVHLNGKIFKTCMCWFYKWLESLISHPNSYILGIKINGSKSCIRFSRDAMIWVTVTIFEISWPLKVALEFLWTSLELSMALCTVNEGTRM